MTARVALLLVLVATPALAQDVDRYGVVQGTHEACTRPVDALRSHRQRLERSNGDPQSASYLARRIVTELDRCLQRADAPASAYIEVVSLYDALPEPQRALDIALVALEKFPGQPDLALQTAQLLFRQKRGKEAAAVLEHASNNGATLSIAAVQLLGAYYYDTGRYERAVSFLRQARGRAPLDFGLNAALGDACLGAGDLPCAEQALGTALRIDPNNALLATRVGDLRVASHNDGRALEAYDRALELQPGRDDAALARARVLARLGLFEESAAAYEARRAGGHDDLTGRIEHARVDRSIGRVKHGIALLATADSDVSSPAYAQEYATSLIADGQFATARKLLDERASLSGEPWWLVAQGDVALAAGSAGEALRYYDKAAESSASSVPLQLRRARAASMNGQYAEARAAIDRVTLPENERNETLVDIALIESRTLAGAGQVDNARRALEAAPKTERRDAALAVFALANKTQPEPTTAPIVEALREVLGQNRRTVVEQTLGTGPCAADCRYLRAFSAYRASDWQSATSFAAGITDGPFAKAAEDLSTAARVRMVEQALAGKRFAEAAKIAEAIPATAKTDLAVWLEGSSRAARIALGDMGTKPLATGSQAFRLVEVASDTNAKRRAEALLKITPAKGEERRVWSKLAVRCMQELQRGSNADAVKRLAARVDPADLDGPERMTFALARNASDPKAMSLALQSIEIRDPALTYDRAIALERSGGGPGEVIELLASAVAEADNEATWKSDASELLRLKQKLYGGGK